MLNTLKSILPIQFQEYQLVALSDTYRDWYLFNIKQDFFSEYQNTKYNVKFDDKVNTYIQSIIDKSVSDTNEIRMVLTYKYSGKPIGGCSISKYKNTYELAYFIIPTMQHKGYASLMLSSFLKQLSKLGFKDVYANIQIKNTASIKLVQKLGFKRVSTKTINDTINVLYKLEFGKTKLRKYENLRILYKGRDIFVNCIFTEMALNKIPLYTSKNISNIQVIRFKTNEILVIVNKNMYDTMKRNKSNELYLYIMHCILGELQGIGNKSDICLAYWFGFTNIINRITHEELGDYTKHRIDVLEKELEESKLASTVPSMTDFLDSINFIEVI